MKLVPTTGSPPMPTMRGVAEAELRQLRADLVRERAGARHQPDAALREHLAGMIPTLAMPGDSAPGQFGPSRRMPRGRRYV